ncbi:hypothetical protein [Sporolactobacillus spathodeae]|uniref:Uncharacterized protein n=1 Tax=Sporolactobacillus spathodeae TaxID=1465502 RepID=A0ABS2QAI3_9BACL|nr:hypothetical protein [Sporolactobacillus spathodeae]MBM7657987.1 hypothetical protein [Sporolactobacillus spathodeae]
MEKVIAHLHLKKQGILFDCLKRIGQRAQRVSTEECLERLTTIMYRLILLFGIPYFLFILVSFIRMGY